MTKSQEVTLRTLHIIEISSKNAWRCSYLGVAAFYISAKKRLRKSKKKQYSFVYVSIMITMLTAISVHPSLSSFHVRTLIQGVFLLNQVNVKLYDQECTRFWLYTFSFSCCFFV